jgi:hypothetical protein
MIKKTLCFSNPAYLSQRDAQLVIKLPEVEKADILSEDFKKALPCSSFPSTSAIAPVWRMRRYTANE